VKNYDATGRTFGFDATKVTDTIKNAFASAGLDTQSGPMKHVTETIEGALSAAGLMPRSAKSRSGITIDGSAYEMRPEVPLDVPRVAGPHANVYEPATTETPTAQPGEFLERTFAGSTGTRAYKVYVPAGYSRESSQLLPMVVMLHGCTQSPDDFAAGTRMNELADEHGFIAVYPAQSGASNAQRCWNWFRAEDQLRERGEPAIIAGITKQVAATYRVDSRRIFVVGMSAGAAMAVILATTYPDVYAAVGAHSGLGYRAAHDVPSAFKAMHAPGKLPPGAPIPIPAIVFHGDNDRTVDSRNAAAIVGHAVASRAGSTLREDVSSGESGGRRFTRKVYAEADNGVVAEHWIVHGAGHAWSGGSTAGTFTDARGPDASREIIRFFFAMRRAGTA
jgi:poly(hydroxyalkanoate) depolymerase family esterase